MKTSKENIEKASEMLQPTTKRIFLRFMNERFPEPDYYTSEDYAMEWAERFETNPLPYMDNDSKNIYYKILREELL